MQLHPFYLTADLGSSGVLAWACVQLSRRPDALENEWSVSGHDY
jgi:hypothetical protein